MIVEKAEEHYEKTKNDVRYSKEQSQKILDDYRKAHPELNTTGSSAGQSGKDASVIGRAVAGGIVAGPAGAVVGALSAVDKNNKKK